MGGKYYDVTSVGYGGQSSLDDDIETWAPTLDPYDTNADSALQDAVLADFNIKGITNVLNNYSQLASVGVNNTTVSPAVYFYFPVNDIIGDNYYPVAYNYYTGSNTKWVQYGPISETALWQNESYPWTPEGGATFASISLSTTSAPVNSPVPEPPTAALILAGLGLIFLAGLFRKGNRQIRIA